MELQETSTDNLHVFDFGSFLCKCFILLSSVCIFFKVRNFGNGLEDAVTQLQFLACTYLSQHMPDDAVRIYKKMIQSGLEPTIHTCMMMESYFVARNYEMGRAVWDEMHHKGCCPDDNSNTVFIGGIIRQGRPDEACKYIEEMMEKGMKAPHRDYNKFAVDFSKNGTPGILEELKMNFAGKFEVSNVLASWADMMKKNIERRGATRSGRQFS